MRLPFIIAKIRKGQVKNMKKTMNTVQAGREMQERSFKRMMAYQKKAEQAVNKKRMNQHYFTSKNDVGKRKYK